MQAEFERPDYKTYSDAYYGWRWESPTILVSVLPLPGPTRYRVLPGLPQPEGPKRFPTWSAGLHEKAANEPRAVCFICTQPSKEKTCASCRKTTPTPERNQQFDCGCTDTRTPRFEKHWRPPNPACPACRGTGKVRDKHAHLGIKKRVRATSGEDQGKRNGHSYASETDALENSVIDKPIHSTGGMPGAPRKIKPPELVGLYFADVFGELLDGLQGVFESIPEEQRSDFAAALICIAIHRAQGVTPRDLAKILPMGKTKLYELRGIGKNMEVWFADLTELKNTVNYTAALVEDLHWDAQQRRAEPDDSDPEYVDRKGADKNSKGGRNFLP